MADRDAKGGMTVEEAGRKGGETTSRRYGHEFYEEIGRRGGQRGGRRVSELVEKGKKAEEKPRD
jgi:uncharacterized protein